MYCASASMSWSLTPSMTAGIEPPSFVQESSVKHRHSVVIW
jgi:hypothetical protein